MAYNCIYTVDVFLFFSPFSCDVTDDWGGEAAAAPAEAQNITVVKSEVSCKAWRNVSRRIIDASFDNRNR